MAGGGKLKSALIDPWTVLGINKHATSGQEILDPLGLRQFAETWEPKSMRTPAPYQPPAPVQSSPGTTTSTATIKGPSSGSIAMLAGGYNPNQNTGPGV